MGGLTFAEIIYFIIPLVIASTVPLTLVATGALYSERSGVVNIALEGIMLMGAYVGAVVIKQLEVTGVNAVLVILISVMFGLFIGYLIFIAVQWVLNKFKVDLDYSKNQIKWPIYGASAAIGFIMMFLIMNNAGQNIQVAMVGLLVGAMVGTVFSLFHAYAAVNMKANQIISATALNMFAPAFAIFVNRTFSSEGTQKVTIQESYRIQEVPMLSEIPSIGGMIIEKWYFVLLALGLVFLVKFLLDLTNQKKIDDTLTFFKELVKKKLFIVLASIAGFMALIYGITMAVNPTEASFLYKLNAMINLNIGDLIFKGAYLSTLLGVIIFAVAVIVLYKTKFGLRLRSCGENPQAADSLGINIYKIRYSGVLVSGALAGMGGVIFVLSFASNFNATVSGFGFLALAVLIFGNWKPNRIIMAALFFAFMRVIANTYSVIPFLNNLELDSEIYSMLPYLATLIVLAFVSKNSAAPKAAGEPYDPGKR
jgi:ABC-type uncharacterized transport system permease subunit